MFLLDTNVISELRKAGSNQCNPQVENWASATSGEQSFLSVITVFELERGVLVMERRDPVQGAMLRQWLDNHVLANYAERIVPVSVGIARRCASLHVPDPMPSYDAMIAATALEHGLTVVTRNIKDFQKTSVKLLNPWVSNDDS